MPRSKFIDRGQMPRTVSAGVLEALGKGLLIATAGLMAGLLFGTAHLPSVGVWAVALAAGSGVGCMVGSAMINSAGWSRWQKRRGGSPYVPYSKKDKAATPVVEAAIDASPEEGWARRRVVSGRQREHGAGGGRGV